MPKKTRMTIIGAGVAGAAVLAGSAFAAANYWKTENDTFRQITTLAKGVKYDPILTVGDGYELDWGSGKAEKVGAPLGSYRTSGIMDGIGSKDNGDGTSTIWVNHELSGDGVEEPGSRISELKIDNRKRTVLSGKYLVDGTEGYRRFCSSNYFAGGPRKLKASGHRYEAYYTGEENTTSIPEDAPGIGVDPTFEAISGRVVTYVPATKKFAEITAFGATDPWENVVALKGYGKFVLMGLSDGSGRGEWLTGRNNRSQLFMFVADSQKAALNGEGEVYVFVADEPTGAQPGVPEDITLKKGAGYLSGVFKRVDQKYVQAKDWRVADKAVEEMGAYTFTRLEDGAQDVRRGKRNHFWFTETGEPEDDLPDDVEQPDGTLGVPGYDANGDIIAPTRTPDRGRLYEMVIPRSGFAADDGIAAKMRVVLDGDEGDNIVSPDNMGISSRGILFNEDRNDQFGLPGKATADDSGHGNVNWYRFGADDALTVARVNTTAGDPGDWESSGTVLAPEHGKDAWLIDVQAHSIQAPQPGVDGKSVFMGHGGQLGVLKVPGSTSRRDMRAHTVRYKVRKQNTKK